MARLPAGIRATTLFLTVPVVRGGKKKCAAVRTFPAVASSLHTLPFLESLWNKKILEVEEKRNEYEENYFP